MCFSSRLFFRLSLISYLVPLSCLPRRRILVKEAMRTGTRSHHTPCSTPKSTNPVPIPSKPTPTDERAFLLPSSVITSAVILTQTRVLAVKSGGRQVALPSSRARPQGLHEETHTKTTSVVVTQDGCVTPPLIEIPGDFPASMQVPNGSMMHLAQDPSEDRVLFPH